MQNGRKEHGYVDENKVEMKLKLNVKDENSPKNEGAGKKTMNFLMKLYVRLYFAEVFRRELSLVG